VETTIRLGEKSTRTDMVESYIDEPNTERADFIG
jgi:hypothetical protein